MSGVVELRVYAELNDFLHPDARYAAHLRSFHAHQTVKDVVEAAAAEHRILLTRDRGLLKRRNVTHGVFVRSDRPFEQIVEVIRGLDLADRLVPFSRCLRCGGVITEVAKQDIVDRLEPLTRRYHDTFRQVPRLRSDLLEGFASAAAGRPRRPDPRRDQAGLAVQGRGVSPHGPHALTR